MVARVGVVCKNHAVGPGEIDSCQHTFLLGNELFPLIHGRIVESGSHKAVARGPIVGVDVDCAIDNVEHGHFVILCRAHHLPLRILVGKTAHHQGIAEALSGTGYKYHRFIVGHRCREEFQRLIGLLVYENVVGLGGAETMEVYAVVFIGVAELLAFFRGRICAVVETVALPVGTGEFRPLDMVGEELLCIGVHHVNLGPVGATARYGIGGVASVVRKEHSGKSHSAVVAQSVRVEEHFRGLVERTRTV